MYDVAFNRAQPTSVNLFNFVDSVHSYNTRSSSSKIFMFNIQELIQISNLFPVVVFVYGTKYLMTLGHRLKSILTKALGNFL